MYELGNIFLTIIISRKRNDAFYQWLKRSVSPHDFVLDIGAGSGILSLFATKSRPKKIIACEASKHLFHIANEG